MVTTGYFELVIGPNPDNSAQLAFIGDVIVKDTDGSKAVDKFCRSGSPPQFPNPVKADNVPKLMDRFKTYRATLSSLGFVGAGGLNGTTRALTPVEVTDFRSVTLTCLADMIALANS